MGHSVCMEKLVVGGEVRGSQGWKLLVLTHFFLRCPRWLSTLSRSLWQQLVLPPKRPTTSSR